MADHNSRPFCPIGINQPEGEPLFRELVHNSVDRPLNIRKVLLGDLSLRIILANNGHPNTIQIDPCLSSPTCLGLLASPPPQECPGQSLYFAWARWKPYNPVDLPHSTMDVPCLCEVFGWPPEAVRGRSLPKSPEGAIPSLAFLAHLVAASHRFLLVFRRPRMSTFSARHSRFSPLALLGDGRSPPHPVRGVLSTPCLTGSLAVAPICGASVH